MAQPSINAEYLSNHDALTKATTSADCLQMLERQKEIFLDVCKRADLQNSYELEQRRMFGLYEMLEFEDDDGEQASDVECIESIDTKVGPFNVDKYLELQYNTHKALKYLFTHTVITEVLEFNEEEMKKILSIEDQMLIYLVLMKCKKD